MGWGLILAMPRPTCLLKLSAVRRISRDGTLVIFPCPDFSPTSTT